MRCSVINAAILAAFLVGSGLFAAGDSAVSAPRRALTNDAAAPLFDTHRLLMVQIELDPADWDKLRREHHDLLAALGPTRFEKPEPNPYKIYRARVALNGETIGNVGLRKRGFIGSASMDRPSLGIRFDEFDSVQRFAGLRRISLNNNLQDPSQIHQVLAYHIFAAAGVPAPRCNLARVSVNGKDLGIYSHVEAVDDDFLRRQFGSAAGNLYEGQISDFRPKWVNTFERKNHKSNPDRSDLEAMVKALEVERAQLLESLEPILDLDEYLAYWAVESLINHWDSYSTGGNNFFLYRHPATKKFAFIPWGADSVLGDRDPFTPGPTPDSVKAGTLLPYRLYQLPAAQDRYREKLRAVLQTAWNEEDLLDKVNQLQAMVRPYAQVSPRQFQSGVSRVRQFIRGRRAVLDKELAGPAPAWPLPVRKQGNIEKGGEFRCLFVTTWEEAIELRKATPVTMTLKLHQGAAQTINFGRVAATPSKDQRNPGHPSIGFLGTQLWDGKIQIVYLVIQPELFKPGANLKLDGFEVGGILISAGFLGNDGTTVGFLHGKLTLDKAGTEPGDTVSGRVEADIYEFRR